MTTLFLYGLGFGCLLIIALLIWDAHIAKRRMRQWSEDWKPSVPPPSDSAGLSGEKGFLPKRRVIFKPVILIATGAAVLLVVTIKRHAAKTNESHEPRTTNNGLESSGPTAGSTEAEDSHSQDLLPQNLTAYSGSFMDASDSPQPSAEQSFLFENENDADWRDTFISIVGGELSWNQGEADFAEAGLSYHASEGCTAFGANLNLAYGKYQEMQLSASLTPSSLSASSRPGEFMTSMLNQ